MRMALEGSSLVPEKGHVWVGGRVRFHTKQQCSNVCTSLAFIMDLEVAVSGACIFVADVVSLAMGLAWECALKALEVCYLLLGMCWMSCQIVDLLCRLGFVILRSYVRVVVRAARRFVSGQSVAQAHSVAEV